MERQISGKCRSHPQPETPDTKPSGESGSQTARVGVHLVTGVQRTASVLKPRPLDQSGFRASGEALKSPTRSPRSPSRSLRAKPSWATIWDV